MTLFEAAVKLVADTNDYTKGMSQVEKENRRMQKEISNLAQEYVKSGMSMSEAMEKANKEITASHRQANKDILNSIQQTAEKYVKSGMSMAEAIEKATKEQAEAKKKAEIDALNAVVEKYREAGKSMPKAIIAANKEIQEISEETADKAKIDAERYAENWEKASNRISNALKTGAKLITAVAAATATATAVLGKQAIQAYAEYEQLVGGVAKIFDQMDNSQIMKDAQNAWKDLNMSANDYLTTIVDVGANFAATMGDQKGYDTARKGFLAISNYASGTGKNIDELSQKFTLITRSTTSYQSIADQFSGILPATSKDFLNQAQAAGYLGDSYKELNEIPIAEYQNAVALMLEKGVEALNLSGNTAMETATTISGSMAAVKSTWANLIVAMVSDTGEMDVVLQQFFESVGVAADNLLPRIGIFLENLFFLLEENAPMLIEQGFNMFTQFLIGMMSKLPEITAFVINTVILIGQKLLEMSPYLIGMGIALLGNFLTGIINKAVEVGKGIVEKIKEGIAKAWNDLVSWFNNLWDSLFNRSANISVNGQGYTLNGSHKSGLDYVPFDGYIAELHKGERVLTAEENRNYNEKTRPNVNVVQNIYSTAKTAADLMEERMYQQKKAVLLGV